MKKILLSLAMLLSLGTASFAQNWEVGQEITNDESIGWGNLSFESNPLDFWTIELSKGSTTQTGGLFEVYDGADVNLYQYVKLPAGMYKVEAQAYYRFGNSWDTDPNSFNTDAWQDLAQLYVQNGAYNIEDQSFVAGRTFKCPLMPRLFEQYGQKIYDMTAAGDPDPGWDMSDGNYLGETVWGPCSVPGSLAWFNAGHYMPYDDGEGTKYNSVTFFLTSEGYARVGVMKPEAKEADSFMATNFKLYYMGEIGEAAEIIALQDDALDYFHRLEALRDQYTGMMYTLIDDALQEFDAEYGDITSMMDKDQLEQASVALQVLLIDAEGCVSSVEALNSIIKTMQHLYDNTNYSGKEAFGAAIAKASQCIDPDYEIQADDDFETFEKAYNELIAARVTYILTMDMTAGYCDFTPLVAYPWFCLPEYEPTWDAESNKWVPNEAAMSTDSGDGTAWSEKGDVNGTINNIAKGVNVYGKVGTPGVWAQSGTEGGSLEVYWNDFLTCIKKWDMPHEGYHDVTQLVTGIPNGYYKVKALGQTWTNDWSADGCHNQIFIQSSTMESFSPYLTPGGWWGNDINQWLELESDMIQVTDGEVTVGFRDNGFAAWTGMRLYYYGETPNFNALFAPVVEKAKAEVETLAWAGDKAYAEALLAKIPADIAGQDEFVAASEAVKEISAYVSKANAAVNTFVNETLPKYTSLPDIYSTGSENEIATIAMLGVLELGEGANDTYQDAITAANNYLAYENYLRYRTSLAEYKNNEKLQAVLAEQDADLTVNFAQADKLVAYQSALATPVNIAKFAALGEATPESPVNVTFLITNPTFENANDSRDGNGFNNNPNEGWTGKSAAGGTIYASANEFGRGVAEIWNQKAFTFSQSISGLPAGTYELRVRGLYRDGGGVDQNQINKYNAAGNKEEWENHNAELYAKIGDNESATYLAAIEELVSTENSFVEVITKQDYDQQSDGSYIWFPTNITTMNGMDVPETAETASYAHADEGAYPFDVKVGQSDGTALYFPASMYGFYMACQKNADVWKNAVKFNANEGDTVEIGLKKNDGVGNDWVIFDDFELYFLGFDPTAVTTVNTSSKVSAIYSVNGVRVNSLQKGINIVKTSDGAIKKVIVK
ncbi:MAG: hypothetical protein MJZ36_07090 [Bacteroidaceae bacterium]|nr:hypothetical protein [Bacteroidaceae bacterium]